MSEHSAGEATPRPWKVVKQYRHYAVWANGVKVARMYRDYSIDTSDAGIANARLIVQAVNAHDALISALKAAAEALNGLAPDEWTIHEQNRAALSLSAGAGKDRS